jgi:hypothetical protein
MNESCDPDTFEQAVVKQIDTSRCQEHFEKCVAFAKKNDKWRGDQGLFMSLERLVKLSRNGPKTVLYKDFAPYSFKFSAGGFHGGLIWHGTHDGGGNGDAPTFSVSLSPVDGWSIHT